MIKKLAKIKYLPNNFQIIENGDYVECAVSGKRIDIENLFTICCGFPLEICFLVKYLFGIMQKS